MLSEDSKLIDFISLALGELIRKHLEEKSVCVYVRTHTHRCPPKVYTHLE